MFCFDIAKYTQCILSNNTHSGEYVLKQGIDEGLGKGGSKAKMNLLEYLLTFSMLGGL